MWDPKDGGDATNYDKQWCRKQYGTEYYSDYGQYIQNESIAWWFAQYKNVVA